MQKLFFSTLCFFFLSACSSTVIVRKDTCKDIYGGTLMECQEVSK